MADFEDDEEDNAINEDMNKFNELGLILDSENLYTNQTNKSNKGRQNNNKTSLNYSLNFHNKISDNLANDSQEEIDENNDAEPEDLVGRNQDKLNNTLDDIWTIHIYGRKDPGEKYIPLSKNAKFFERILHPIQYGSLRGSIFGLSSMCLGAGSMLLAKRCQQFGLVNFLVLLILGGLMAYSCLVMMIKVGKNVKEKNYSKVVKNYFRKKSRGFNRYYYCYFSFWSTHFLSSNYLSDNRSSSL